MQLSLTSQVPLAPLCSLELGGQAEYLAQATSEEEVRQCLLWARHKGLDVTILGGGSNVVIADGGIRGVVLLVRLLSRSLVKEGPSSLVQVEAAAGEPFDELVAWTVDLGLFGLECLSGIPGLVGATPIQNVGAYGQEVADTVQTVRVLDRETLTIQELPAAACGFAYRNSLFKQNPQRYVVLGVRFSLKKAPSGPYTYRELVQSLKEGASSAQVRDTVLRLRRSKSMVLDKEDENRRSVGSFFLNPVVSVDQAEQIERRGRALSVLGPSEEMPQYPMAGGASVKLAAAWLIERAGIHKGLRQGQVGVSSRHTLALVHHGGGTSLELVALARSIRQQVFDRFGVLLQPEPLFLGFSPPPFSS